MSNTNDAGRLFDKTTEGKNAQIFSDIIMGYKPTSLLESITFSIKECVRNNGENTWNCFWSKTWRGTFESQNTIQRQINKKRLENTSQIRKNEERHKYNNALNRKRRG